MKGSESAEKGFTKEQTVTALRSAALGTTVANVYRKYEVSGNILYRWKGNTPMYPPEFAKR